MRRSSATYVRRRSLGALVLATAAAAVWISVRSIDGVPFSGSYTLEAVVPADAPILRPGDEVRIGGERAGQVQGVSLEPAGRTVSMDIDAGSIGRDARAAVHLRGLAGAVYVDVDPGHFSSNPAPSGWTIPRSRTSSGTQLSDVVASFGSRSRAALQRTLTTYGLGMAGRGSDLNGALADLPPTLSQGRPLLEALVRSPGELTGAVAGFDDVMRGLGGGSGDELAGLITAARQTFEATGRERTALAAGITAAPGALSEARRTLPRVDPLLENVRKAGVSLAPAARRLADDLPSINALLARTGDVDRLATIARAAEPVLRPAGPALERLAPASETLGPLARALEPLAAYVSRYPQDVFAGPHGFETWGGFHYDEGQATGHRAVRFTPIFTCPGGRDPYPAPGQVGEDRKAC